MELEITGKSYKISSVWNISKIQDNAFIFLPSLDYSCASPGVGLQPAKEVGQDKDRLGFVLEHSGLLWDGECYLGFQSQELLKEENAKFVLALDKRVCITWKLCGWKRAFQC